MSSSSSLIGRRLGKYEIVEFIGRGGMASVYKGYQPDMDRFVAVKVLPPHPGQDDQFIDRFRLEARTIAQLQHPHILPVHDYGTEEGILYLVIRYVEGGSLKDRIDEGPIPLYEAETILRQVASALDYAHRRNVIHRDVKPDNILLDGEGHAMLADFGIVKILEGDKTTGLTTTGGVLGTPAYMAPEQSQGLDVTVKADIYALGVIVYEMLTGHQPFQADTPMQVMLKHITEPVPSITGHVDNLPPALEAVMLRVLAKQPEDRYDTASDFAQEFLRALHHDSAFNMMTQSRRSITDSKPTDPASVVVTPPPTQAPAAMPQYPPVSPTQTSQPPPVRTGTNPVILLGGFAIIALLAVIIVLLVTSNNMPSSPVAASNTAIPTEVQNTAPTSEPATSAAAAPTVVPIRRLGRLSFSTEDAPGDTANLRVEGLRQLASGSEYAVWLANTTDENVLGIGIFAPDGLGNGVLHYTDPEGRMLPALYDAVIITEEETQGDAPAGEVVYSGKNPAAVRDALAEIFIASDAGISNGSLYDGAMAEAELAVIHTSFDHGTHDLFGLFNRTEHTMNILLNTEVDHDRNGIAENPGFKHGLPYFLEEIESRLDFDYSEDGVRSDLRSDVTRVVACLNNARQRLEELVELEMGWTSFNEATEAFAQAEILKSEAIISGMIEGVDRNQNNQIEGFPGECGLRQLPSFGLLIGTIDLREGEL